MTKIETLIKELCPQGIPFRKISDLGYFYGGLSGKSKADFVNGNAAFISYKNIYSNPSLDIHPEDRVSIQHGEKQNIIQYGDILFTGSSETPDECAISSVVCEVPNESLYLNSFCFGLRLSSIKEFDLDFLKHYFRSHEFRVHATKCANGVTRFNVSKKLLSEIAIPVPPLYVQHEIASILNSFSTLKAELSAELSARKQQYDYYRNQLLTFDESKVDSFQLSRVAQVCRGTRVVKNQLTDQGYPVFQNCLTPMGYFDKTNCPASTPFVICGGAAGNVGYTNVDCWAADDCEYIKCSEKLNSKYLYHLLIQKQKYLQSQVRKASIPRLSPNILKNLYIPVPSIDEQLRIVLILDKFESIIADISTGIPAEINAVEQQYEYYRNVLLDFERADT